MVGRTCRVSGHLCSSFLDFHHLVQKSSFIALWWSRNYILFFVISMQFPSNTSVVTGMETTVFHQLYHPLPAILWTPSESTDCRPPEVNLHGVWNCTRCPAPLESWTESKGFIDPVSQELGLFDHRRSQEQHGGIAGSWIRTLTIHMLISSVPCVTNTDQPQIETIPMHRCSSTIHKNKNVTLPLNILQDLSTYPKIFGFLNVPSVQLGRNDFHWAETRTTSWTSTEERRHGLANPDKLQIKTQW